MLRRGMARFFVAIDDGPRAIDAYRQVLARAPESHDDRVAAAELLGAGRQHAEPRARGASTRPRAPICVMRRRIACWFRSISGRAISTAPRASGTMLSLLGYAEATDRPPTFRANIKRGSLSDELRRTRLLPPPVLGAYTEALAAVRETLDEVYGVPAVHNAIPAAAVQDPGFKVCVVDAQRLFGVTAEVYVAQQVPGRRHHLRLAEADGGDRGDVRRATRTASAGSCSGARSSRCGAAMRSSRACAPRSAPRSDICSIS